MLVIMTECKAHSGQWKGTCSQSCAPWLCIIRACRVQKVGASPHIMEFPESAPQLFSSLHLLSHFHYVVPYYRRVVSNQLQPRRLSRQQTGYHNVFCASVFPDYSGNICRYDRKSKSGPSRLTILGPTPTGRAPFLAQSNPAPFGTSRSFVAHAPLEPALPIVGDTPNSSIFHLMGQLSPYFPNPE